MKLFFIRHQLEGVLHAHPFDHTPTEAEIAEIKAKMVARHGETHKKTGAPLWMQSICVEDGVTTVLQNIDGDPTGGCEIKKAGHEKWPEAVAHDQLMARLRKEGASEESIALLNPEVYVSGKGHVKNP